MTAHAQTWQPSHAGIEPRVVLAGLVSFGLHLGLFLFLTSQVNQPVHRKLNEISLDVVERPKPVPPPPEKPPTQKVERVVARLEKPLPRVKLPPPPNQTPPKEVAPQAPPPIHIGVNLESTVTSGAIAAPVGNSMYGVAPVRAPPLPRRGPTGLPTTLRPAASASCRSSWMRSRLPIRRQHARKGSRGKSF